MSGRAMYLVAAVVLSGVALTTIAWAGGPAPNDSQSGGPVKAFSWATFPSSSKIRGTVTVVQRGAARKARAVVSLHGLKPATRYRIAGSTKPCREKVTGFDILFPKGVRTAKTGDDAYVSTRVSWTAIDLGDVPSYRVLEVQSGGKFRQRACGFVSNNFQSPTGN